MFAILWRSDRRCRAKVRFLLGETGLEIDYEYDISTIQKHLFSEENFFSDCTAERVAASICTALADALHRQAGLILKLLAPFSS